MGRRVSPAVSTSPLGFDLFAAAVAEVWHSSYRNMLSQVRRT